MVLFYLIEEVGVWSHLPSATQPAHGKGRIWTKVFLAPKYSSPLPFPHPHPSASHFWQMSTSPLLFKIVTHHGTCLVSLCWCLLCSGEKQSGDMERTVVPLGTNGHRWWWLCSTIERPVAAWEKTGRTSPGQWVIWWVNGRVWTWPCGLQPRACWTLFSSFIKWGSERCPTFFGGAMRDKERYLGHRYEKPL